MLLSITGLVKTVLIIIGVMVVLRFIGQLMNARRNISHENQLKAQQKKEDVARKHVERNQGKINLIKKGSPKAEDVDYEEL